MLLRACIHSHQGENFDGPQILPTRDFSVSKMAISPGERWIVGTGPYGPPLLWNMKEDDLTELACQTAGRNLSKDEWKDNMNGVNYHMTCAEYPPGQGLKRSK